MVNQGDRQSGFKGAAGILYVAALICVGIGFWTMYYYGDGSKFSATGMTGHIVGGDAYNYIIMAVRGVGWIATGLTAAVVGAACSIMGRMPDSHIPADKSQDGTEQQTA